MIDEKLEQYFADLDWQKYKEATLPMWYEAVEDVAKTLVEKGEDEAGICAQEWAQDAVITADSARRIRLAYPDLFELKERRVKRFCPELGKVELIMEVEQALLADAIEELAYELAESEGKWRRDYYGE